MRPYQLAAIDSLRASFAKRHKRTLLVAPTGSGKGRIIAELLRLTAEKGNPALCLVHRREIVRQLSDNLTQIGLDHGVILAGEKPKDRAIQVGSIQTISRRTKPPAMTIALDEAHHVVKGSAYERLLEEYPNARVIGPTATPTRADGRGLGDLWQDMVVAATPAQLRDDGFLVNFKGKAFRKPEGLDQVKTIAGDFDVSGLAEIYEKPKILGDVVDAWLTHAKGKRTIAFVPSIRASQELVERMLAQGVAAAHLDYKATKEERDRVIAGVRSGAIQFLSNVAIASEGFDCPELECVIIARPTKSLAFYLQMCGRVTRPAPGKECAYLLDHGDVVARHGHPYAPREWTLDTSRPKAQGPGELKTCPKCFAVLEGSPAVCPECGAELRKATVPIQTDHNVVAFDIEETRAVAPPSGEFERILLRHRALKHPPGWAIGEYRSRFPDAPIPWGTWRRYVGKGKGAPFLVDSVSGVG